MTLLISMGQPSRSPLVKKVQAGWERKLKIFQSIGLDALIVQFKHLKRLDAYYIRFLHRIVGIKASHNSQISNHA